MSPGRNDPCPCGSGRKYKHCHGVVDDRSAAGGPNEQELRQLVSMLHGGALGPLEQRCQALLEAHPATGMVWKILSVALMRQGKEALPALRRAVQLLPRDAETHLNLGLAQQGAGHREEAAACYRRALALDPGSLAALGHLGAVLRELGERTEAVAVARQAVALDPHRAESHCDLGSALFELRRVDEAAAAFREALSVQPAFARALLGLAATLRMRGRIAEAEEHCRSALAVAPQSVEALSLLGELHADRGQFVEARHFFEQALAIEPDLPEVYCSLAAHRKMTPADDGWRRRVEELLTRALPVAHEIGLRYALGKYLDDLGRYAEAFDSYRRANELTRRHRPHYSPKRFSERVERIITSFDARFMSELGKGGGADSALPVLIIGMPRSGTSLAEQILASHPSVFGGGELRFWEGAFGVFEAEKARGVKAAGVLRQIASDYLERLQAASGGAARAIDKMPANFLYLGLIHAALPRARIIHMQRHPLDTCLSIYCQDFFRMGTYANDLDDLAHYYTQYLRIMAHWRSALPAATMLEVRYEEMVRDQESCTRRMLEFLGLPWDARCLDFHRTERVVLTASRWQVRQKLTSTSVGRWRHYQRHLSPLRELPGLAGYETLQDGESRPDFQAEAGAAGVRS